jgi:hypothetical protein
MEMLGTSRQAAFGGEKTELKVPEEQKTWLECLQELL